MKKSANVRYVKCCAFCRYWYDPTNSAIAPINPRAGIWEITDTDERGRCLKKNTDTRAGSFCSTYYECKL